jgi:hypothetical protein
MQYSCTIFSSVACPAVQYFSTLSHKKHYFRKIVIEHNMCFDFPCNFCVKNFLFEEGLSKIWLKMYIGLHVKYSLFFSYFNETWIFSTDILNITKYQISWKSVDWETNFHAERRIDEQTDRRTCITKLIVAFRNFANAPKKAHLNITSHFTRLAVNYPACLPTYKCLLYIWLQPLKHTGFASLLTVWNCIPLICR